MHSCGVRHLFCPSQLSSEPRTVPGTQQTLSSKCFLNESMLIVVELRIRKLGRGEKGKEKERDAHENRHERDTQMCSHTQRWVYQTTHTHTHPTHTQIHPQIYIHMHTHPRTPTQHPLPALRSRPAPPLSSPPQAGRGAFPGPLTVAVPKLIWPVSLVICSQISAHRGAGPGLRSGPLTFSQEVPLSAPPHPNQQLHTQLWAFPLTSITC